MFNRHPFGLFAAFLIALFSVGACRREEVARARPLSDKLQVGKVVSNQPDLLASALEALRYPGIPEAPLSSTSTRQQRSDYLIATEAAMAHLIKLPGTRGGLMAHGPALIGPDRTTEILSVSRLLAVNLADAIDRSDPVRAEQILRIAFVYADAMSRQSIEEWLASGAVADTLAQGIKSVGTQLDSAMSDRLRGVIKELEGKGPSHMAVLDATAVRLTRWRMRLQRSSAPVKVGQLVHLVGGDPNGRPNVNAELAKSIEAFVGSDTVSAQVVREESKLVVASVLAHLRDGKTSLELDREAHPIAALYMSLIRPSLEAAAILPKVRHENLRLLSLTLR
ncbi:MAG: hypothetical protein H0W86_10225, partial [Armatimonadetes bacterium]|nr:hypothetical protein [Armatimonadota bacterium]